MDTEQILATLKNKSLLITGSTGFLAKIFVEKILRLQPDVKRLYLLLRADDQKGAMDRFRKQVVGKEVFKVLREKHGKGFDSFMLEKVVPLAGDISLENLGIDDENMREELWGEVEIVINVAATVSFDDRYDVAIGVNTLGAKHILEFAKKCVKLEVVQHISTAYVAGVRPGLILEKPLRSAETLDGSRALDIDAEIRLVEEARKELNAAKVSEKEERIAMKQLGMKRARYFGWPNTYVFTKAMGEMLLERLKGDVPLVILRPTIITSTYREPFPGWVEGTRTIDSVIAVYASGRLTCFLGDHTLIADVIPGDMVVNAMVTILRVHSNKAADLPYHLGSSVRHPVQYRTIEQCSIKYFNEHPRIGKDGRPIVVRGVPVFSDLPSFRRYMYIRYKLPLEALGLLNTLSCGYFDGLHYYWTRRYKYVMRLVDTYEPYLFFRGCFDDINTEKLRSTLKFSSNETMSLGFDPKEIDWDDYFLNIHIPGFVKHAL